MVVAALSRELADDRLVVDPDVLAAMSHDEAEWAPAGKAVAGVRARSEDEVQHVVRVCAEFGVPVVPRGAGTGLSGGANAVSGCVVLDLSRMSRVLEIDPPSPNTACGTRRTRPAPRGRRSAATWPPTPVACAA